MGCSENFGFMNRHFEKENDLISLQDDKLNRKDFLNKLFNIFANFGNQNGHGITIILNGAYGAGKTTLLNFIIEKNKAENDVYTIIKYDAWDNNLFRDPLNPILHTVSKVQSNGGKIKETAKNIIKNIPKVMIGALANMHGVDLQAFLEKYDIFEEYDEYTKAIDKFKVALLENCNNKKMVLLIDELDRCLPEYQIRVLEILYHFLDIPNLIVIIALDKQQLEQAIRDKFGNNLDITGYLTKFIRYEINLPIGDRYKLIYESLNFKCEYETEIKQRISHVVGNELAIPIRELGHLLDDINLICNEVDNSGNKLNYFYWYPFIVLLILLLKKNDKKTYNKFFGKEKQVVVSNEKNLMLEETIFGEFLEEIKGSRIEKAINWLKEDNYGSSIIVHFINMFIPIRMLDIKSVAKYTNRTEHSIEALINDGYFGRMWEFPNGINKLMGKLNALI